MKEKNNIEEGFLFDAEEIGKQETDTQTSEGTENPQMPPAAEEEGALW